MDSLTVGILLERFGRAAVDNPLAVGELLRDIHLLVEELKTKKIPLGELHKKEVRND